MARNAKFALLLDMPSLSQCHMQLGVWGAVMPQLVQGKALVGVKGLNP